MYKRGSSFRLSQRNRSSVVQIVLSTENLTFSPNSRYLEPYHAFLFEFRGLKNKANYWHLNALSYALYFVAIACSVEKLCPICQI